MRLEVSYIDHPKFLALTDGAFRLWHEGKSYCEKHLTDGLIPLVAAKGFRHFNERRQQELQTVIHGYESPLWEPHDVGFKMHDYLDHNECREVVLERMARSKDEKAQHRKRQQDYRDKRKTERDASRSRHACVTREADVTDREEKRREVDLSLVKEQQEREKSASLSPPADPFTKEDITRRAGLFLERYQELYPKHRQGARYALKPVRDYAAAVTLCQTWVDDERLDKLAVIFLTTDHKFAEEGSRTVPQFLALASWCDGKLAAYEAKKGSAA